MDDTTSLSYWLNWRFFLCALWVVIAISAAGTLITKYEIFNKKRNQRPDDELDVEPIGILYEDETWQTSFKAIHPVWLLAYRLIAFIVLLAILSFNLAFGGIGVFFFYTQWTFALVIFYFGLASSLSIYGCYQYWIKVGDDKIEHVGLEESLVPRMPLKPSTQEEIHLRKTSGIWGYSCQIVFQTCAGAVGLTDSVFWFILYPFLSPATYKLNFINVSLHSLNIVFLLIDLMMNRLVGGMKFDVNFSSLIIFSAFLRVFLIVYGEWQDTHMEVRYTDVDYIVFSDAAALVVAGNSPYKRSTYRYSPLIAYLLTPNSFIHRSWGKFLFSASDLLVGYFIRSILKLRGVPENITIYSVIVWLFNPFTFTIGTRGNCEPIVCAIILWIIICLMRGKLFQGALWYGLVVHMRIYPIIYALPIIVLLDPYHFQPGKKPSIIDWNSGQPKSNTSSRPTKKFDLNRLWVLFASIFTRSRILFGLISASIFFFFTGIFFYLYKWEFLHEALLYHLTRTDPRHNFSIYFYYIYLNYEREFSVLEKLVSFLPQLIVQIVLISRFAQDFPFCFFVQTVAFVAFNKVITAQYFVWFFCLLPLTLPWSKMKLKWEGIVCILFWIGAQTHWLYWGYMLEFKGKQVFLQLWAASLLFFAANTYVMTTIILRHTFSPIFKQMVPSRLRKNK